MSAILKDARRLADYMLFLDIHSRSKYVPTRSVYNHLGALLVDVVLQSGLNYQTVVRPRVLRVLSEFFYASTTQLIKTAIKVYSPEYFMSWKNTIKTTRFLAILDFCERNNIEDESDLRRFLIMEHNKEMFLQLNGVGPKTADYALKLMGVDCVAVDRHVYSFVKQAGIESNEYRHVKMTVEYAADLLCLSRTRVDSFIWSSMNKNSQGIQAPLLF